MNRRVNVSEGKKGVNSCVNPTARRDCVNSRVNVSSGKKGVNSCVSATTVRDCMNSRVDVSEGKKGVSVSDGRGCVNHQKIACTECCVRGRG